MLYKMKLWDKILICSFIIISLAWFAFVVFFSKKENTKTIEIKVYGNLVEKLTVTEDADNIYNFEFGDNTGYIEVKDGAVKMLEMERKICPDAICSKTGWISNDYEIIVCMPNGITVNIKSNGNNQKHDIDIVV